MPPINVALLATILGVQLPVMIGLPLLLGWFIRRRYGIGWGVFAAGAATFAVSQLVHIPLNVALGLLGAPPRGIGLWPLIPRALAAGLSAGLSEEVARLVIVAFLARSIRGWRAGLQYGAGHGGFESILLGLLAAVNIVAIIASRSLGPATQALPPEAVQQLQAAQTAFWSQSAWLPFVGALERVFAITSHIAMASLVVYAVTHRRPLYFVAAVLFHTALDFWAVVAITQFGILATELGVAAFALLALGIIRWLRGKSPEPPHPEDAAQPAGAPSVLESGTGEMNPVRTAADLSGRELTPEELAQRAERSRYE